MEDFKNTFKEFGSDLGIELTRNEINKITKAVREIKITKDIVLKAIWMMKIFIKKDVNESIKEYGKENLIIIKRLAELYCVIDYKNKTIELRQI